MVKHVIVVTCTVSGEEALYVGGSLQMVSDVIYACDIAEHSKDGAINLSHVLVELPDDQKFPGSFDECLKWVCEGV